MNKIRVLIICIAVLAGLLTAGAAYAIRNICKDCGHVAEPADITCAKCDEPLNICLACDTMNEVAADFCVKCNEDMSYMRVLSTIDPDTRDELRLGQSDRARLERSLSRLNHLLDTDPDNAETYLYRRAKVYQQMAFWAGEANAWADFLRKFPNTPKQNRIQGFYSEALRKWGFLFYQQGQMETAGEKFELATKANPMNTEAWLWAGRCAMEGGRNIEAAEFYLSGLKSEPGNKTAIHFLRLLKKGVPKDLLSAPQPAGASTPAKTTPASTPAPTAGATPKSPKVKVNPEAASQMPPVKKSK